MGTGSSGYRDQEDLQSALCQLRNQESWRCNSYEHQGGYKSQTGEPGALMSEGRGRYMSQGKTKQFKQGEKLALPRPFVLFRPSVC